MLTDDCRVEDGPFAPGDVGIPASGSLGVGIGIGWYDGLVLRVIHPRRRSLLEVGHRRRGLLFADERCVCRPWVRAIRTLSFRLARPIDLDSDGDQTRDDPRDDPLYARRRHDNADIGADRLMPVGFGFFELQEADAVQDGNDCLV